MKYKQGNKKYTTNNYISADDIMWIKQYLWQGEIIAKINVTVHRLYL